jgi:hypothetical protein
MLVVLEGERVSTDLVCHKERLARHVHYTGTVKQRVGGL